MKLDFNAAKEQVATENGYKDFLDLVIKGTGVPSKYFEAAAELYAQWMCNEAVKDDRNDVLTESYYDRHHDHVAVRAKDISDRPLPFPQQPDGL